MRDKLIAKIRALRAKTEEAGATEHEALAAAEKAADLMDEYEVTEADLADPDWWAEGYADMSNGKQDHRVLFCTYNIGRLTGTKPLLTYKNYKRVTSYLGERADVELATWLHDVIRVALDTEYDNWRKTQDLVGRGAKAAFQAGMVGRLNHRMTEIIDQRAPTVTSTSRALVIAKDKAVEALFRERNPRLRAAGKRMTYRTNNAFGAGYGAGDKVGFGRPVTSSRTLVIGHRK